MAVTLTAAQMVMIETSVDPEAWANPTFQAAYISAVEAHLLASVPLDNQTVRAAIDAVKNEQAPGL